MRERGKIHEKNISQEKHGSWKKAVVAGSVGAATVLFLKKKYPAGVLATGVGLAVLAAEYPEKFEKVRGVAAGLFRSRHASDGNGGERAGRRITEAAGQRPGCVGGDVGRRLRTSCAEAALLDAELFPGVRAEAFGSPGRESRQH